MDILHKQIYWEKYIKTFAITQYIVYTIQRGILWNVNIAVVWIAKL